MNCQMPEAPTFERARRLNIDSTKGRRVSFVGTPYWRKVRSKPSGVTARLRASREGRHEQLWHVLVHYGAPVIRATDRPPEID